MTEGLDGLALDSAERARLANALLCPALAASQGEWAFDDRAEMDRWFEALEPVLPGVELAPGSEAPWLAW